MFGDKSEAKAEEPLQEPAPPTGDATLPLHELPPTSGADAIVRKWAMWAAGFGLVPIPLFDFATTAGFSMKMLHSLSKYYGVEFRAELGKTAITSLLGGASTPLLALMAGSFLKSIPLVGYPLAVVSGPLAAGGITYAIGRVFTAHFGAGGTLFDFDPEKFRDFFQQEVEAGKAFVRRQKSGAADDASATTVAPAAE